MREVFARMCRRIGTGETRPDSIARTAPLSPTSHYVRTEVALGWGYPAPLVISRAVSRFDLERHATTRLAVPLAAGEAGPDGGFDDARDPGLVAELDPVGGGRHG